MIIRTLSIHNFRSIKDITFQCESFVVLLGPNNHGKSNILLALDFFFSPSNKPDQSDLFMYHDEEDSIIWVEVEFTCLNEQEQRTFAKYVTSAGSMKVRKTAMFNEGKPKCNYNGWVEEPVEEWLKSANAGSYTKRADADKLPLAEYLPDSGKLAKSTIEEAQRQYIQANHNSLTFSYTMESGNFMGQANIGGGILPEFNLVPAVRDLTDETKIKNTALLGKLVNKAIEIAAETSDAFGDIQDKIRKQIELLNAKDATGSPRIEQLRNIQDSIRQELFNWDVNVDIEISSPPIDKIFELGTNLHIDDGVRTLAERKGHGLQRALIFALIKAWSRILRASNQPDELKSRTSSSSVLFAIEEPELFLHPQAQREFMHSLLDLCNNQDEQVFICTHSSHFIDMTRYRSICIITKPNPRTGSTIRTCSCDLFEGDANSDKKKQMNMAYWINPDRGEMFFGRKVVFVEGPTEKTMLPYLAEKLGILDHQVSIVDCGSKHNLPIYIDIANAFHLDYMIIHDEDPLPEPFPNNWPQEKRKSKQDTFKLNAIIANAVSDPAKQVHVMKSDFEAVAGISKNQGKKLGKPMAALEYFEKLSADDVPEVLKQVVQAAYS